MLMYLKEVHAHNILKNVFSVKEKKYVKRRMEGLVKCVEMRAIKPSLDAATDKQDFETIFLASTNLIAVEALYHASFYKNYIVKRKEVKSHTVSPESEVIEIFKEAQLESYKKVVAYMHVDLENRSIVRYTDLLSKMRDPMENRGLEMKKSTRVYLKRNIETKTKNVCHISIAEEIYLFGEKLPKIEFVLHPAYGSPD